MGSLRIFDYCHYAALLELKQKSICERPHRTILFVWSHVWIVRLEDISHHGREKFTPRRAAPCHCCLYDYFLFIFVEILNPHAFRFLSLPTLSTLPAPFASPPCCWFIIILLLALFYELSQTRLIYVTMR